MWARHGPIMMTSIGSPLVAISTHSTMIRGGEGMKESCGTDPGMVADSPGYDNQSDSLLPVGGKCLIMSSSNML